MSNYTTGDIAKICNVSVRTVQYYDNRGILVPSEISDGGRRLYTETDLSKMKIICFLKELDLSLDTISKLMKEDNSKDVISLILEEQQICLKEEIKEKNKKLDRLNELNTIINKNENFAVENLGDIAHYLENKMKTKKLHRNLILFGLPFTILEWVSIIILILTKNFWPLIIYLVLIIPFAIIISKYYFSRVEYICPHCHEIFRPKMKEAFWANHTPTTRKLTCVKCGKKSFCVETYRKEQK